MRCQDAMASLSSFLEGTLSEEKVTEIEEHLAQCAACASRYRNAERKSLPLFEVKPSVPESLNIRLQEILGREVGRTESLFERSVRWFTTDLKIPRIWVLAYFLALAGALVWGWLGRDDEPSLNTGVAEETSNLQNERDQPPKTFVPVTHRGFRQIF